MCRCLVWVDLTVLHFNEFYQIIHLCIPKVGYYCSAFPFLAFQVPIYLAAFTCFHNFCVNDYGWVSTVLAKHHLSGMVTFYSLFLLTWVNGFIIIQTDRKLFFRVKKKCKKRIYDLDISILVTRYFVYFQLSLATLVMMLIQILRLFNLFQVYPDSLIL